MATRKVLTPEEKKNHQDFLTLCAYIETAESKEEPETVYLFRYYQSEYFAVELSEGVYETGFYTQIVGDMSMPMYGRHYEHKDTNAYLCQMWVQLDFDIIGLTFTKDNVDTVIPVIMSPMDIAADGTPPLITTKDGPEWWQILLAVLALILVIWLLFKFAPVLVLAVGKVIALPFKAIGAAGKSLKERRKEKKAQKQSKKPPDGADDTEV